MPYDADGAALLAHLRTHAHTYFDGLRSGEVQVELLDTRNHRFSKTYRFRVTGPNLEQDVLAKVLSLSRAGAAQFRMDPEVRRDRPRLAPVHDWANIRPKFEYRSLSAARDHFDRMADPRLGAVRPLEYLAAHRAIVMEVIEQPTLRHLLWKATRFQPRVKGTQLDRVFRHAGAWLRQFHQLPADENGAATLREKREDVVEALRKYSDFLSESVAVGHFFRDAVSTATARSATVLPNVLPLGRGHGDFAPRNVFVSPDHRVTVIDMLGKWQVPIYEDLAYFVNDLRTSRLQRLTYGLAFHPDHVERYEDELLTGYFGQQPVPRDSITLFNLLILFDKWSAFVHGRGGGSLARRGLGTANREITRRYFFREARRLVGAIAKGGT